MKQSFLKDVEMRREFDKKYVLIALVLKSTNWSKMSYLL